VDCPFVLLTFSFFARREDFPAPDCKSQSVNNFRKREIGRKKAQTGRLGFLRLLRLFAANLLRVFLRVLRAFVVLFSSNGRRAKPALGIVCLLWP
jgi:hypothetical protein